MGEESKVVGVKRPLIKKTFSIIKTMLFNTTDSMKSEAKAIPLVAVGGGAFLVPDDLPGNQEVIQLPHASEFG